MITVDTFSGTVGRIEFTFDGRKLIAAGDTGTSVVFDVATRQRLRSFVGHKNRIMDVATSPDGQQFASVGDDQTVRLWDLRPSPQTQNPRIIRREGGGIVGLDFSPDGTRLISSSHDRHHPKSEVEIWSTSSWRRIRQFQFAGSVNVASANFTTRGNTILLHTSGSGIWTWRPPAKPEQLFANPKSVTAVCSSPSGRHVGYAERAAERGWPGEPVVYHLRPLDGAGPHLTLGGRGGRDETHRMLIWDAAFSPDGQLIATVGRERSLKLWDTTTAELIYIKQDSTVAGYNRVTFSPDGQLLVTVGSTGLVLVTRLSDKKEIARFRHDAAVQDVCFMPDNETLVTASYDKTIRIWDIPTAQIRTTLRGHEAGIDSLAVSPNGHYIASGDLSGKIYIWSGIPEQSKSE